MAERDFLPVMRRIDKFQMGILNRVKEDMDRQTAMKAEGPLSSTDMAPALSPGQSEGITVLTRLNSSFLSSIGSERKGKAKGEHKTMDSTDRIASVSADEYDNTDTGSKSVFGDRSWNCQKLRSRYKISREDLIEAIQVDESAFQEKYFNDFMSVISNDLCRLAINGDSSIAAPSTRLEKLLVRQDGFMKKIIANSTVLSTQYPFGAKLSQDVWDAPVQNLPEYLLNATDGIDWRWFTNPKIQSGWNSFFKGRQTDAGDTALMTAANFAPNGVPIVQVNQMTSIGDGGNAAVAPTEVVDNTSYITFTVGTAAGSLFADAIASDHVQRLVKCTFKATSTSGYGRTYLEGGVLKVNISGQLGQTTVSETEADYKVNFADLTDVLYTPPMNLMHYYFPQDMALTQRYDDDEDAIIVTLYHFNDWFIKDYRLCILQRGVITPFKMLTT